MIRKLARPMLASVYVAEGADTVLNSKEHLEETQALVKQARTVLPRKYTQYLPEDPELITKALGATKVGAGSLLAIGKAPRLSAATLALLSVPTLFTRHSFWTAQNKEQKQAQRQGFITNVALLGGLAITSVDTAGKPGLKWRANKAVSRANKQVKQALPGKSETEKFSEAASENAAAFASTAKGWFGEATEKVSEYADRVQDYVDENKADWLETAQDATQSARASLVQVADSAQDFFKDNSGDWLTAAQKNAKVAKKRLVKSAVKAQERADKALAKAEKRSGRSSKNAHKHAEKLRKEATKAIEKAQKKIKNFS
ncbi:DoxX family membrane protein [Corynebacterium sp. sy017]|uniref:DoxX family protein n=1 Tax=unclassified Corynebacterium TaxID=2624378 RepID=UPI0011858368|nr:MULTISPECIES: DoxX family protein [unclassified Corynebacterium]MBP3089175.1 DoxX family membrane protein [Corynebacterium sp. sy017]QDZ42526.1 DoxX family protein [Corynebacterium sp. sy039]TSD91485.1 DoxX family membrane protein [Corynebacterium sp. SY003]